VQFSAYSSIDCLRDVQLNQIIRFSNFAIAEQNQ
jgi:hypothetical protein